MEWHPLASFEKHGQDSLKCHLHCQIRRKKMVLLKGDKLNIAYKINYKMVKKKKIPVMDTAIDRKIKIIKA